MAEKPNRIPVAAGEARVSQRRGFAYNYTFAGEVSGTAARVRGNGEHE